ncbi:MAG: hypothetical protein H0U29_05120 [Acidimicrobiia bacterium]|nr:hypothetical protein [Acidimicrobiia bacterium]
MTRSSGPGVARRAIAVIATVVAVAVGLVAAAVPSSSAPVVGAPTAFQSERPTRVLAVGDSVMEGAAAAIAAELPGREVLVDTEVSRSTSSSAEAGAGHGTDWDVVVILLGHNDGGSPGVYQPPYRRLLDHFADAERIVVLTIHEVRPYYAGVNRFLRDEAAARSNVQVADWNATVSGTSGTTAGDGLHLSGRGAQLMAGLIADQVAEAETGKSPPSTTEAPITGMPATGTPTSAPPTTTAPGASSTTATEPGALIPATSTARPPPINTSVSSTRPTRPSVISARSEAGGPPDEGGDAAPPATWALLFIAAVATALALQHVGRRFPT